MKLSPRRDFYIPPRSMTYGWDMLANQVQGLVSLAKLGTGIGIPRILGAEVLRVKSR